MYQVVEKSQLITGRTPKRRHEGVQRQKSRYLPGLSDSFLETFFTLRTSLHKAPIYLQGGRQGLEVELALQWTSAYSENVVSFVNNINTIDGGTHVSGFRRALTRTL